MTLDIYARSHDTYHAIRYIHDTNALKTQLNCCIRSSKGLTIGRRYAAAERLEAGAARRLYR